ncbi:MAG: Mpv17/PMP22 family protein [Bacteroidales bacterium]|nr:Mpv17/PMP22 family protein [Bacteroidales bacterium]
MKTKDILFASAAFCLFLPFFLFPDLLNFYKQFNAAHGMLMSFIKFSILATMGESIGLRIRSGRYNAKGFGIIPRAIVWGFLGMSVKIAFIIFGAGAPAFLEYMGMDNATGIIKGPLNPSKLLVSFTISTSLNLFYAPVLMTFHKITDIHISSTGGTLKGLFTPIKFAEIFPAIDWKLQWDFIFKKTIPLFWIPMQTINFLFPPEYQILFAALLGIALGVLLALASQSKA